MGYSLCDEPEPSAVRADDADAEAVRSVPPETDCRAVWRLAGPANIHRKACQDTDRTSVLGSRSQYSKRPTDNDAQCVRQHGMYPCVFDTASSGVVRSGLADVSRDGREAPEV